MFFNQGGGGPGHIGGYGYGGMPVQDYIPPRQEQGSRRDRDAGYQFTTRQGVITKIQPDYGLIDDEVFFSMDTVLGFRPRLGLRVQAEASFDPNTHPRWRAVRVTALSGREERIRDERPMDRDRERRDRDVRPSARDRDALARDRDGGIRDMVRVGIMAGIRDMADRDARRRDEKRAERVTGDQSALSRKRSRSPAKAGGSPPRRRIRMPKYLVATPKYSVDFQVAAVTDLRRRYSSLYIPSDFFLAKPKWQESFPLETPFSLDHVSNFHIFHKDVEPLNGPRQETHPVDADYKYSAKVMLMSLPGLEELYKKTLILSESAEADREAIHPSAYLKFLVGNKGKHEYIPIGGPWSPSLDGADPENDPEVLVKTAIRTCKMLTGIDLSNCTQWCRFMELYYRRPATGSKPATVETVVIYLPDVWNCMPTRIEWDGIKQRYKTALDQKLDGAKEGAVEQGAEKEGVSADDKSVMETTTEPDEKPVKEEPEEEKSKEGESTSAQLTRIQIESMKVVEIKAELEARGLSTKGVKAELCTRLVEALEKEEADAVEPKAEDGEEKMEVAADTPATEDVKVEKIEPKVEEAATSEEAKPAAVVMDEKEKKHLEQIYAMTGSSPAIVVHPSKSAKKGEFNCTVLSLKSILDIPHGDLKEHTFEAYLFAMLFQDMLVRDTGVNIYRALYKAPDLIEEEKKQRKEEKEAEAAAAAQKEAAKAAEAAASTAAAVEEDINKVLDEIPMEEGMDEDMLSKFVVVDQLDDDDNKKRDQPAKKPVVTTAKENGREPRPNSQASSTADSVKKKQKKYTADKNLLFSFIFYDQDQCGYILDKDMEDILLNVGLRLSRAQIKKLLSKVVGKNNLYYRKLTDKYVPEDGKTEEEQTGNDEPEGLTGNIYLLPSDVNKTAIMKKEKTEESAIVSYNGRVYNLDQLLQQAERSEKDRLLADSQLKKNQEEMNGVKSKYDSTASKLKKAEDELKSLKSKLSSLESKMKETKVTNEKFESALRLVYHHVAPFVEEKKTSPASGDDK